MNDAQLTEALRVYLVADPDHCDGDLIATVRAAIAGGVTSVQLRAKSLSDREALGLAYQLRELTLAKGVLFLINDRIDLAVAAVADGVHLGVDDLPLEVARVFGGPAFVIGYSPETDVQAMAAAAAGANYLGVGPVFGTATKSDAGAAIGLPKVSERATSAGIPVIGIGGVTAENAGSVISAGAVGVAVVSAIAKAADPCAAASALAAAVRAAL
ncbi:MAG TPA: thiamine phosphate synthase [Thermomicrobiales bacterium]|nr:thiamine phosphate synthase [Thermomicrobiales bacterium]